jgi:hypothetical protein
MGSARRGRRRFGVLRKVQVFKGQDGWDVTKERAGKNAKQVRPSEINHGNIAPTVQPLGVTCDYAEHTAVLSFAGLRRLAFGGGKKDSAAVSKTWATCTPIVLDRHLKAKGNAARDQEVCELIAQACTNVGLPPPARAVLRNGNSLREEFLVAAGKHSAIEGAPSAAKGVERLTGVVDFGNATDLKLEADTARELCRTTADRASDPEQTKAGERYFADLCAALFSDAAMDDEHKKVEPTFLAYPSVATSNFLKNFKAIAKTGLPDNRPRDPSYPKSPAECIFQALSRRGIERIGRLV